MESEGSIDIPDFMVTHSHRPVHLAAAPTSPATSSFAIRPATFLSSSFTIPGAFAQLDGTYNLESEAIDLHGTLKTGAELSRMTSGFKSVLLKPLDVFFQRKHAGAVVAAHLVGTCKDLQPGRDLPVKSSSDKSPAPREIRTQGARTSPLR